MSRSKALLVSLFIAASFPVTARGATHFIAQEKQPIKDLACGGQAIELKYASSPDDQTVFLDLDNTGSCPMEVVRMTDNREADRFTVPGMHQAIVRITSRGDLTLRISCPANAGAATCAGTARFVSERKGKAEGAGKLAEWVLMSGDPTPAPMTCSDAGKELRLMIMNRGGEAIRVQGLVENTGGCRTFGVEARVAGMQNRHSDDQGGAASDFSFTRGR